MATTTGIDVGAWLSAPNGDKSAPCACGLFITDSDKDSARVSVPLRRRDVAATIYAGPRFAETRETLSYVSDVDCTAVFRFPLPPRAAVFSFSAVVGDRRVETRVKPRSEAREEYTLALQQGHTAVHMEQHEAGAALYEVSVGNLPAHTECEVTLAYLQQLDSFGSTLEWLHTATWVPPYTGSAGDAARTAAGGGDGGVPAFAAAVTYSLSYDVTVVSDSAAVVRSVESPQQALAVRKVAVGDGGGGGGGDGAGAHRLELQLGSVGDPSRDFTLLIELDPAAAKRSNMLVQRTPKPTSGGEPRTLALATFVPPELVTHGSATKELKKEVWFIVDCSGSMSGSPISQAKQAALFLVRDLPPDASVRFNVTCFGSHHKTLHKTCQPYNADTERKAVGWIESNVKADMGGTEILETLKHVYGSPVPPGFTREVIFLTDGGISPHEEQAIYGVVSPQAGPTAAASHVLCLGIGHGVHRGLLNGMADRTSGAAAYVTDKEAIGAKVAFLKRAALAQGAALRPRLTARGALVRAVPHVLPQRLFAGEPLHVLLEVVQSAPDAELELSATYPDGAPLLLRLPLGAALPPSAATPAAAPAPPVATGDALGVLHAMAYIGSLLGGTSPLHVGPDGRPASPPPSEQAVREAVVRLALAANLVTPHTSAVGVALQRDPLDPRDVVEVDVPLQLPHGRALWGTAAEDQEERKQMRCMGGAVPRGFAACSAPPPPPDAFAAQFKLCSAPMPSAAGAAVAFSRKSRCAAPSGRGGGLSSIGHMLSAVAGGVAGAVKRMKETSAAPASYACAPPPPCAPSSFAMRSSSSRSRSVSQGGAVAMDAAACSAQQWECATATSCSTKRSSCSDDAEEEDEGGAVPLHELLDEAPGAGGAAGAPQQKKAADSGAAAAAPPGLKGTRLLDFLNLNRTTQGYWCASSDLAAALGLPLEVLRSSSGAAAQGAGGGGEELAALRPSGLSDDAWATALVLGVLRCRLAAERAVWSSMEAKALGWLGGAGGWPAGAGSVGGLVLALAKRLA